MEDNKTELKLNKSNKEYDIYRDSYLRYLGYSNEIGEAFRPLIPRRLVNASYALAISYCCLDVFDKSAKTYNQMGDMKKVGITACDVFSWQMLASVIIPGLTINRITWLTARLVRQTKMRKQLIRTAPTFVGLCSIPFIIHPIDKFVDYVMDNTYRKWLT